MKFPNRQKTNKKKKYADVVCNSSPATDVTDTVNCKFLYLIEFFSLVKMSKIYTKARTGQEQKGPNKQLLTNGRSLDEETVKPVVLACKQKSLFIAVIVPPNTVPAGVWFDFLVKVLKCTYKNPDNMCTSPELGWQASSRPCWRTLLYHKQPTPQSSAGPEFLSTEACPCLLCCLGRANPGLVPHGRRQPCSCLSLPVAWHSTELSPGLRQTGTQTVKMTSKLLRHCKEKPKSLPAYALRLNTVSKRLWMSFSTGNMEQRETRSCPRGPGLQPALWPPVSHFALTSFPSGEKTTVSRINT